MNVDNFMPHGACYLWQPGVLGLHVVSDALITVAYFCISFTLAYFVHKRKDLQLQFHWIFICFAVFIVACGGTHLLEVWVVWHPTYWLSGSVKAATAMASVTTAILLVKLVPQAMRLPSPSALRTSNAELQREIAERKRAESDIRRLNAELEQRVAERTGELEAANRVLQQTQLQAMQNERLGALGEMASGIAHDINNSLSPAALFSRLLLERNEHLSPEAREYLTDIERSIQDVVHTVTRLRDFYRARETQLVAAPVQLNRVIEQVVDLTRARWHGVAQERGIIIHLEMTLEADLPQVLGVESEIRDALVNLILNAVDAMPEGGTLAIRSYTVAPGEVPARVRVEVCDTGMGMTEETRRKCLEPFFTTKGERGTGLGLAMVYGMVQRHRAEIEIDSAPGEGATVSLIFPGAGAVHVPADQHGAACASVPSVPILIVDDDPRILKSLRRILEVDGHRVTVADGGQAGIDAFIAAGRRGEPFALVILDLGMPYVDGRKAAASIKAASPLTPIVLVTGWGHGMRLESDLPAHVDRLLCKPPDMEQLRKAIFELTAASSNLEPEAFGPVSRI